MWGKEADDENDAGEVGWDEDAWRGFDLGGGKDVDENEESKDEDEIFGVSFEGAEVFGFEETEEVARILGEDKSNNEDDNKWDEAEAEVVKFVHKEMRDFGTWRRKEIAKGNVIKSFGGGGVGGVAVHAWAEEKADEKAECGGDEANEEPKWRTFDGFAIDNTVYNNGGEDGDWRDGGGHAK